MTKSELAEKLYTLYSSLGLKKTYAIVNLIVDKMAENLLTGEGIEIRRLGSFRLKYHKVCPARNPKTDQKLMAKEKYSVCFKPSKELKRAVNETRIQGISANTDSLKPE